MGVANIKVGVSDLKWASTEAWGENLQSKLLRFYSASVYFTWRSSSRASGAMLGLVQVPSTSEAVDAKGVYTVFDVHLNGNYHGSVRYSQLLAFHQEVRVQENGLALK